MVRGGWRYGCINKWKGGKLEILFFTAGPALVSLTCIFEMQKNVIKIHTTLIKGEKEQELTSGDRTLT